MSLMLWRATFMFSLLKAFCTSTCNKHSVEGRFQASRAAWIDAYIPDLMSVQVWKHPPAV